jgi:L-alanine-DL-glutamate epimerase-like enolase superfamily enzyme
VKLECDGLYGYGEASLPPYLGETQESVISFLRKSSALLSKENSSFSIQILNKKIDSIDKGNTAAKAALDIALHDLKGKLENKPVFELYGLPSPQPKFTTATISIGDITLIADKINEQKDFEILKIKLGTDHDEKIIEAIRDCTDKKLVLDVNQGWRDRGFALEMIQWLKNQNILFVEQPMPKEDLKSMEWLKERSDIPLIADEAFQRLNDLDNVKNSYHGINIKLMKCTGIYEAINIITAARKENLKINLGCMTESSCAVSAAARIMSCVDWIDLDGPLLVKNDPFTGITYDKGKVHSLSAPGIGASPRNAQLLFEKI